MNKREDQVIDTVKNSKASIIIPTRNKLHRLKITLLSIENQDCNKDAFEVILVDNDSTDGTGEYILNQKFSFPLVYKKHSILGRSAARNEGIAAARYPILIFCDDDVILSASFVSEHIRKQSERPSVVHGKIYNITYLKFFEDPVQGILYDHFSKNKMNVGKLQERCIRMDDIIHNFDKIKQKNHKVTGFEQLICDIFQAGLERVFWIGFTGGNVSVRKDWVIEAGGFDTGFGTEWGFEDLELGYRLWQLNYDFVYWEAAANYHMAHYRFNFDEENKATSAYFYEKHQDDDIKRLKEFTEGKWSREELVKRYQEG